MDKEQSKKLLAGVFLAGSGISFVSGSVQSSAMAIFSNYQSAFDDGEKIFAEIQDLSKQLKDTRKSSDLLTEAEKARAKCIKDFEGGNKRARLLYKTEIGKIKEEFKRLKRLQDIDDLRKQEEKEEQIKSLKREINDKIDNMETIQEERGLNEEDWKKIVTKIMALKDKVIIVNELEDVKNCDNEFARIREEYDKKLDTQRQKEMADVAKAVKDFKDRNENNVNELKKKYTFKFDRKKLNAHEAKILRKYDEVFENLSSLLGKIENIDDMKVFESELTAAGPALEKIEQEDKDWRMRQKDAIAQRRKIAMCDEQETLNQALIKQEVPLEDVYIGNKNVVAQMKRYIQRFKNYVKSKGRRMPPEVGIVLRGDAGTGKTFGGNCVFASQGCEVKTIKIGTFANNPDGLMAEIKSAQAAAKTAGRTVVIIFDDADSVLSPKSPMAKVVANVVDQEVGLGSRSNTRFCITCNRIENLAPELLRAGRFGEAVDVNVMSVEDIEALLKNMFKLYGVSEDVDAAEVAKKCSGKTPAFIKSLIREAAGIAERELEEQKMAENPDYNPDESGDVVEELRIEKRHISAAMEKVGLPSLD